MEYSKPKQSRAYQTETIFLDAFAALLQKQGFHKTTISDIADAAQMTRSAFMSRFGSKRAALTVLFRRFCDDVRATLAELHQGEAEKASLHDICFEISARYEALVRQHWGANRAMHEIFLLEGKIDDQTKEIFKATTTTLSELLIQYGIRPTQQVVFAAVQLLVTINNNYVLMAMPGLPADHDTRQRMIAQLLTRVLTA